MTNNTSMHDFIAAKFGQAQGYITVWRKRANATKAFPISALKNAVTFIEQVSKSDDAYIAIGTQTEQPKGGARGVPKAPNR
jgi:hypothetical protein